LPWVSGCTYFYDDLPTFAALLIIGGGGASLTLKWESGPVLTAVDVKMSWFDSDFDCMAETRNIGAEYDVPAGEGGFSYCITTLPLILTPGPLVP